MSGDKLNINQNVMEKIRSGEVKMRSRWYFVFGSIFLTLGVVASLILAVFFISVTSFSLRTHGPMGSYRLSEIWASFPWWAPLLSVAGLALGIWLLRKYDFSYKKNFIFIVAVVLLAVVLAGVAIDYLGLNDVWLKRGPMRYGQGAGMGGQGWRNNQ